MGDKLHIPDQDFPPYKQPVNAEDLAKRVLEMTGFRDLPTTVRITNAVVGLLCGRVTRGEVEDMAEELPDVVGALCTLRRGEHPLHRLGLQDFLEKVAGAAEVDLPSARLGTVAVFKELRHHLTRKEIDDVGDQLPSDLKALWRGAAS